MGQVFHISDSLGFIHSFDPMKVGLVKSIIYPVWGISRRMSNTLFVGVL